MVWLWSVVSVDVLEEDLFVQSILNTRNIQKAFLWYENVHVASNAPVGRKTCCRWCTREDEVYLSSEEGKLSHRFHYARWWKSWKQRDPLDRNSIEISKCTFSDKAQAKTNH